MRRRDFLAGSAGLAAGLLLGRRPSPGQEEPRWDAGEVAHLLPTVSHDRFLIKASFTRRLTSPPSLRIAGRRLWGVPTDSGGRFWRFDVPGLEPMTSYRLALFDEVGRRLCDPWTLGTFPPPDALPTRMRLLVYTCAGGHEGARLPDGTPGFLPLSDRRRLLRRALSYGPDAVLAVGDHVYWDLRGGVSAQLTRSSELARRLDATGFRRELPVLGTENEARLQRIVDPQIASLYGTLLRSTPVFFVQDDHDYFENDYAGEDLVTFPPDPYMLRLARATQHLYYPEFLPDPARPRGLGGTGAPDRAAGASEAFGTLRYGRLLETLIYDCRRYLSLKGPSAVFAPTETEEWLLRRLRRSQAEHVVNVPSTPLGWTAGKWAEWYPDVLQDDGTLGTSKAKPFWQEGWLRQHDRLLAAAAKRGRGALFVSGDLHALGCGRILAGGGLDVSSTPVTTILAGPLGTGPPGWPSAFRGTVPRPSDRVEIDERLAPLEKNGFTLLDFTPDGVEARLFAWEMGEDPAVIDALEPLLTVEI